MRGDLLQKDYQIDGLENSHKCMNLPLKEMGNAERERKRDYTQVFPSDFCWESGTFISLGQHDISG